MKEYKLLKFLDLIKGVFSSIGVDHRTLRAVLQLKLTMDSRRIPTVLMNSQQKKESKNPLRGSLIMYFVMGAFIALFMLLPFPVFIKMNVEFGMLFFMLMSIMISDFSSVLLDLKEKTILLPRPVDERTINTAKVIHIIYYLLSISTALAGPLLLIGLITQGVAFFAILLLEIILMCCFIIFFTSMLYLLILYFFDGEKLKDIITYFQITLSLGIMIFYQLAARVYEISKLSIKASPEWWHYLIPTAWFSAPFAIFIDHEQSTYFILLSILAVVVPVAALVAYMKLIVPVFEQNLMKLGVNSARRKGAAVEKRAKRIKWLSEIFCRDRVEQIFFKFTYLMVTNERKLKLRIYPSLVFAAVFPFIISSGSIIKAKSLQDALEMVREGYTYLWIYFAVFMMATSVMYLANSESFKGAWVYGTVPLEEPGKVFSGAVKGFIVRFILPVFLPVCFLFLLIFGLQILPDILLININMVLVMLAVFKIMKKELPFSRDFQVTQDVNAVGMVFVNLAISAVCAGVHFGMRFVPFGVFIDIAISATITFFMWRSCFNLKWNEIIAIRE